MRLGGRSPSGMALAILAAALIAGATAAGASLAGASIGLPARLATRLSISGNAHIARADDPRVTARGRRVYAQQCASCHGRALQGQPLWQLIDRDSARRAPAHDKTGHTWMHPDEDLFQITKFGRFASTPPDRVSYMPAFGGRLDDGDIFAAIAYIEATWPVGLRAMHAALNPGGAGMPRDAGASDWRLPAWCPPPPPSARTPAP